MNEKLLKIVNHGRFMGVFPFEISVYFNEVQLSYSKPFIIYSQTIFILLIVSGIFFRNDEMPTVMRISHQISQVFAAASHILILSFKKGDLECFINKIQMVDKLIGKEFKVEGTKCAKVEICVFFFTFPLMLLDLILYHRHGKIYHELGILMSNLMLVCLDTSIILNYKSCVKVIRAEISNFREELIGLFDEIEKQHHVDTVSKGISESDKRSKINMDTVDFFRMVKGYRTIFDATEALNSCYNLPILISSIICMVNVISIPFLLYHKISATKVDMAVFTILGWLIGHILKILIIVEPCHSCQNQGRDLAQLLMRFSCNTSWVRADQLRKFHAVVEESPVRFHIGGIANITRSLYPAILSGCTTYLVILFQMQNDIF